MLQRAWVGTLIVIAVRQTRSWRSTSRVSTSWLFTIWVSSSRHASHPRPGPGASQSCHECDADASHRPLATPAAPMSRFVLPRSWPATSRCGHATWNTDAVYVLERASSCCPYQQRAARRVRPGTITWRKRSPRASSSSRRCRCTTPLRQCAPPTLGHTLQQRYAFGRYVQTAARHRERAAVLAVDAAQRKRRFFQPGTRATKLCPAVVARPRQSTTCPCATPDTKDLVQICVHRNLQEC